MECFKIEDKWMVFAVTGLANFIATFTTSSINLALPSMAAEFSVSMGAISWVSLIYMLTLSCTLLMFGRLADLYGYKQNFIGGFALFSAMSLLLPLLSVNLPLLILFRFLQALGGSMLVSITHALVSKSFCPAERGKALGINSVFVSIGLAVGPSLGGWLVSRYGWPSLFYINIPVSLLGILTTMKYVHVPTPDPTLRKPMDWWGALIFGITIFSLSVAINFADDWGLLSLPFGLFLLGFLAGLALFILYERKKSDPLMALHLFANPHFSKSIAASMFSYLAQMMTTFLMPFYLVNQLLMGQDRAGLIMLATPVVMMVTSPYGGQMADRLGTRRPAMSGLAAVGLGCLLMSRLNLHSSLPYILFALGLFGLGNGISVAAINTAIISSVPSAHTGVASGMSSTIRNIGQSLGVAFGGMLVAMRSSRYGAVTDWDPSQVYLTAQRDTFLFGVLVAFLGFAAMASIPRAMEKLE